MIKMLKTRSHGPIGVDIGSRSVKLLQFNADRTRVLDAARRELPSPVGGAEELTDQPKDPQAGTDHRIATLVEALRGAREGGNFRGRDAVVCLGAGELHVHNVRLPKSTPDEMERLVHQEAANRLPFPQEEAELRFLEAADVRQGDAVKREVILLACHRPRLKQILAAVERSGLKPIAVDVEPLALLRCYGSQFRRDEDQQQRAMFVHIGAESTAVVIAHGREPLFIKYVDVAGRHFDEAVATHLQMDLPAAATLRRHNGDRRADQQDREIARSVADATRGVVARMAAELAMCVRYHSVTFRGQPLARIVLGGGEASAGLAEEFARRLDVQCELGDPLRKFELAIQTGRRGQWDLAVGTALRERARALA
jgi:type IV pilus assembly protein PilM